MLTLANFETQLPPEIVKRGRDYAQRGAVLYIEEVEEGQWQAEVEGTETYTVDVTLSGNQITSHTCDCPYDGGTCKHAVAVFFTLRDQLKKSPKASRPASRKVTLGELLRKIEPDELREFVAGYAARDKPFATQLELYFSYKDERIDVTKKYTDLVQRTIRTHSDRGFVDYREAIQLGRELGGLLEKARQLLPAQNPKEAFTVSQVLLRELMPVIESCDDSNGSIGGTISETIDLLDALTQTPGLSRSLHAQVFDFVAGELPKSIYYDYGDFGHELLDVARHAALALGEPNRFLTLLDRLLAQNQNAYRGESFRTERIRFLREIGQTDEANRQTETSLDIVEVRRGAVEEALKRQEYTRAKSLLAGGIQLAEQNGHPGTVRQWEEIRLDIAQREGDTATVRQLARRFTFDRNFEVRFFRLWKNTFTAETWLPELDELVAGFHRELETDARQRGWGSPASALTHRLAPIFIEEQRWADLLELARRDPRLETLQQLHPYLAGRYPADLLALYLPALHRFAETATGRGAYAQLADHLLRVRKDIVNSAGAVIDLAEKWIEKYPRRPALREELGRVLRAK